MTELPLVTIHTPTWNRASTLSRVWESLRRQTFEDFEWIVSDDGSDDETPALLDEWRWEAPFPMTVYSPGRRVGKPVLDNHAVRQAKGAFFLTADSDDAFAPHALSTFIEKWESIPDGARGDFVGITARSQAPGGQPLERDFPTDPFDTNYIDLKYRHGFIADKWNFCRTAILRQFPFPEVDLVVPEGVVWNAIGQRYKTRCVNDVLKTVHYGSPNAISGGREFRYSRGKAFALTAFLNDHPQALRGRPSERLRAFITLGRYSAHTGRPLRSAIRDLERATARAMLRAVYPISLGLAVKDKLQRRVIP